MLNDGGRKALSGRGGDSARASGGKGVLSRGKVLFKTSGGEILWDGGPTTTKDRGFNKTRKGKNLQYHGTEKKPAKACSKKGKGGLRGRRQGGVRGGEKKPRKKAVNRCKKRKAWNLPAEKAVIKKLSTNIERIEF